ncbi:AAA family ATPase, partial [Enterobacter roggenkampii]
QEIQDATAEADFQDLGPVVAEELIVAKDAGTDRFRVVPPEEFSSGKRMEWIIKGILPRAELCVIYGESGSGKSFLTLDLCAA